MREGRWYTSESLCSKRQVGGEIMNKVFRLSMRKVENRRIPTFFHHIHLVFPSSRRSTLTGT
jgi:hypothetical protein